MQDLVTWVSIIWRSDVATSAGRTGTVEAVTLVAGVAAAEQVLSVAKAPCDSEWLRLPFWLRGP